MNKGKTSAMKRMLMALNIVTLIGLAGFSAYLFVDNRDLAKTATLSEEEKSQIENDKLIASIGKLINLPNDEKPTIFKVNDPEKIEEGNPGISQIFPELQKDDYLLIYKNDRLGIQYRPNENKIIKTATVSLPVTIEIFGTEQAVNDIEATLQKLYEGRVVILKQIVTGVTQNFVYDKTGKLKADVDILSEETGFEVGSILPTSITPSEQTEIIIVAVENESSAVPTSEIPETE